MLTSFTLAIASSSEYNIAGSTLAFATLRFFEIFAIANS
jgi:hypothetical protein